MIIQTSFKESTKPFESFCVPFLFRHTAHKYLNGSSSFVPLVSGLNTERFSQLVFWNSSSFVDFVSQDHDWHLLQLRNLQNSLQLDATFFESLGVWRVN